MCFYAKVGLNLIVYDADADQAEFVRAICVGARARCSARGGICKADEENV